MATKILTPAVCYHCGNDCVEEHYVLEDKNFCCVGCRGVYQVLSQSGLCNYYNYNDHPGANRARLDKRFEYLDEPSIIADLVDYTDENVTTVTLYIPYIHCSSCIWLLEQLNRIEPAIFYSRVDFLKKQVNVRFKNREISLRQLVELMYDIGYEPLISLQDVVKKQTLGKKDNLVKKIAVAGFCFGNVMLLSFPEYLGLSEYEQTFKHFFGWLNILFSLPAAFYCGWGYFTSAYHNLKNKVLNIDFPLALGIAVMFIRTVAEILTHTGPGFADTLCGLVFFLLVGKFVQQKTYYHISFERDYRSFFPVSVQVIEENSEKPVPLADLKVGNRILIRHNEIIPADAILLKGDAQIDFSFVTGESLPVSKTLGEVVYAGGRQMGEALELEVVKPVSQSYLTQLWNNEAFTRKQDNRMQTFSEKVSKYFTIVLLTIAFGSLLFWSFTDFQRGLSAFTAVLIVACPCALALSTPFTMSAALSIFDKNLFYLKNTAVVEQLAAIDTIVLDKTGTITVGGNSNLTDYTKLDDAERQLVYSVCSNSGHPLSRQIGDYLGKQQKLPVAAYQEIAGKGITAQAGEHHVLMGSCGFVLGEKNPFNLSTEVHLMIDEVYKGYFSFKHLYREGLEEVTGLKDQYQILLLSGDNDHERTELAPYFEDKGAMHFNKSPQEKLDFIQSLQQTGRQVMMMGDGLNDSGALKQSDLGVAITDNVNNFSPGSDAILDGHSLSKLPRFLKFAKNTVTIIHCSFLISLSYNLVGLSFAVTGKLSALTAAILMPLSTATIISFTSIATHVAAKKRKLL
ncbi:heavy metal translocating P-type ATPase metal-binding domain-containing protein [Mucilaginibacter sp. RS28]|uniref:Heavy metal translocating P-type ATPase metal-binding domain-containing protein n=1 Tax=Mucilaginibacter straminoryzae TaxID=2932774 RepID=A0A9X2BC65_9SPHI|nr:heavy metal translocating P-type ATPase metal-binding domain-containing protein [Mucilaginibacter straminoryzae]MCJ8208968.1 heavy metal translocating P-type ATPase metal-binding domain-containing protein [Mucilaginibacter straminoryzae]